MSLERETEIILTEFTNEQFHIKNNFLEVEKDKSSLRRSEKIINKDELSLNDLSKKLYRYDKSLFQQDLVDKRIVNTNEDESTRLFGNINADKAVSLSSVSRLLRNEGNSLNQVLDAKIGENIQSLSKLLNYDFRRRDELNKSVGKHDGAIRVDILTQSNFKMIKNPKALLTCLKYLEYKTGKSVGYGLKHIPKRGKSTFVPFTIDYDEHITDGIFYVDQRRAITVKNILNIERVFNKTKLSGAKIIANKIGLPAKKFVERLNLEKDCFELLHFDSIVKETKTIP